MQDLTAVDTETLAAALSASAVSPSSLEEAGTLANETAQQERIKNSSAPENNNEVVSEEAEAEAEADVEESEVENTEESSEETQLEEESVSYTPAAEDAPPLPMQEYERMAFDIRLRNPDISLENSIEIAKNKLGIFDSDENNNEIEEEATEQPATLQEELARVEQELDEEGANEGLFTPKIAELTKLHSKLTAQAAIIEEKEKAYQENNNRWLQDQMEQSRLRVLNVCPEAGDSSTIYGAEMGKVIQQLSAENNPILSHPDAPEKVWALVKDNLERNGIEIPFRASNRAQEAPPPAPKPKTKLQKPSETLVAPQPPAPIQRALPVSASVGSAQPEMSTPTQMTPAQMSQLVREADGEGLAELEKAIYGNSGRDFLLRI